MSKEKLNNLQNFLNKDKFSSIEWQKRGLNPSSDEICHLMSEGLNNCCIELIELQKFDKSKNTLKKSLKKGLSSIDKRQLDTEEKEFVCDCFYELAAIVSIEINDELNSWMYGSLFNTFMKIIKAIKGPDKIVETLSQDCTKCKGKLETFITKKEDGIPAYSYDIVKCKSCKEYNLIDRGPNIKMYNFGNYEHVEYLNKSDYTLEQAKDRLEQIKYWRK